jgi:phasin
MSTMSEQVQSRRYADKSAAISNETVEKGKATAERSAQAIGQSYSTAVENMRDYNLKMIDMAQANIEAVFGIARQLATAKTPSDMIELWTSHTRRQFEMLSDQTKELTALGQKLVGESAAPIARSVNQAFSKAS